jgi:PAS domain S-box-containing protein
MKRILIVDDNYDNRLTLKLILEGFGDPIDAVETESGLAALSLLASDRNFHAIFLDIEMPGIDGYETLRRIRAEFKEPYLPVILITAYALSVEDRIVGYEAGCDEFITKPADLGELYARLRSVLRIKSLTDKLCAERDALGNRVEEQTVKLDRGRIELLKSEDRYRSVFENASTVIVCLTQQGEIREWNRSAETVFLHLHEEIIGRNFQEVCVSSDMRPFVSMQLTEAAKGGTVEKFEFDVRTKDGSQKTLSASLSVFFFPEDQETGIILIGTDVTEQKQLQQRLRRAERLESIGTLAGGIAHDFNNVLAAIMGNLEMAMDMDAQGKSAMPFLNEIMKASLRSRDLVRQILTFCRKTDEAKEPIFLAGVLREVLGFVRASLPSSIVIEDRIDRSASPIVGATGQIHEVVMNLCTNAAHAMAGKGTLTVGLKNETVTEPVKSQTGIISPGDYLKVFVRDTGVGMDRQVLDRIFEPFFTTKGQDEGTGMGLAMVHGIVEDHGGQIVVTTRLNEGSLFEIYFPKAKTPLANRPDVSTATASNEHTNVLFVDDEPMIAKIAKDILGPFGYHTRAFTDSADALAVFQDEPDAFDVVVTDLTMPGMNGLELGEKIHEIRPKIPVIICTGYSAGLDGDTVRQKGVFSLLSKPLSRNEMNAAIRRALEESSAEAR